MQLESQRKEDECKISVQLVSIDYCMAVPIPGLDLAFSHLQGRLAPTRPRIPQSALRNDSTQSFKIFFSSSPDDGCSLIRRSTWTTWKNFCASLPYG